jgi:hypothetical protein
MTSSEGVMKTTDPCSGRVLPMRPAPSRNGLYALASAWHSSGADVHPFVRPNRSTRQNPTQAFDKPEPPYLPDGPSAA